MAPEVARKQEKDYSSEVDALVPEATQMAESGRLQDGIDKLLALEKLTRNAADLSSTSKILVLIPTLAYRASNLPVLNSSVVLLAKRHGQLKEAVVKMIDTTMTFLAEIETKGQDKEWLELLETLRTVTEGKIYLELPRARLTTLLSRHHEKLAETAPAPSAEAASTSASKTSKEQAEEAKQEPVTSKDHLDRAADLLSDLQVETYSSMEKREKTEFILDQMRLESQRANWVRVRVGGRKINRAYLKEDGNADLKLRYYELIIQLALEEDAFLDACKAYQQVYDTAEVKDDPARAQQVLESITYFIVLAPHDNEQSDMIHKLALKPEIEKLALHHDLVKSFTVKELMRWSSMGALYGETMRASSVFAGPSASSPSTKGDDRWEELHKRVIEHNIRTIALYYTRITLGRLAELLDLPASRTEQVLSKLVVEGTVFARIDRPAGVVDFRKKKDSADVLNDWSGRLGEMLGLIEKTSHLINKEYAVHAAKVVVA